jgi:hypothetical protein
MPKEDSAAIDTEHDVHRPDKGRSALLHQCYLAHPETWDGEDPSDRLWQVEGVEAPGANVDKEIQEMGPRGDEGS